jgi:hypothetical protein
VSARKALLAVWRDAIRDSELDAPTKAVAFTLSTYMNGRGFAYPSKAALAAGASVSKRTVDATVDRLEAAGFIELDRSRGRRSNHYQASLPPTVQELRRSEWSTVQLATSNRAADDTNRAGAAPESSRKRKKAGNEAAAPDGASSLPEGECWGCKADGALVEPDFHYCRVCAFGIEAPAAEGAS